MCLKTVNILIFFVRNMYAKTKEPTCEIFFLISEVAEIQFFFLIFRKIHNMKNSLLILE